MEYIVNCIRTKPFVRIKANFGIHKIRNRQIILYIYLHIVLQEITKLFGANLKTYSKLCN